jgi:hypothetical protein
VSVGWVSSCMKVVSGQDVCMALRIHRTAEISCRDRVR